MPKVVNHEQRKEKILKASLATFASMGYENATMSHIATRSRISRPTIYQYFQNKEEIFYFAIKTKTDETLKKYYQIWRNTELNSHDKLQHIFDNILSFMYDQKNFIKALISYITHQNKERKDIPLMIRKRTIRLELLFVSVLKEGIKKGEIRNISPPQSAALLWNILVSIGIEMATIQYPREKAKELLYHYITLLSSYEAP